MPEDRPDPLIIRVSRSFITDRLLDDELVDARERAPILVGILLCSTVSALLLMIALGTLYSFSREPLHLVATLIAMLTFAGYVSTLWHFKQRQALLPSADLYALTTTFATVAPCIITGGMSASPYTCLILVVPVFLFLIAGRKHGLYWTMATMSGVGVLFAAEFLGLELPQVIPEQHMAAFTVITWLTTLALLILGLVTYEENVEALKNRISVPPRQPTLEEHHQFGAPGNDENDTRTHATPAFHSNNVVTLAPR